MNACRLNSNTLNAEKFREICSIFFLIRDFSNKILTTRFKVWNLHYIFSPDRQVFESYTFELYFWFLFALWLKSALTCVMNNYIVL